MKIPFPPTRDIPHLLELLKRALPHLEVAEAAFRATKGATPLSLSDVAKLQIEIVDTLLAHDVKPFDEYENPAEAVTDENKGED